MRSFYDSLITQLSRRLNTDLHYFVSGGFWLSALQIITLAGGLITSVLFSNLLDPSSYGIYKYIIGLGVLFSTFSLTGITQSIQQTAIKGYDGFFPFAMRKSFVFSVGIVLSALAIGAYYFYKGDITLGIGCLITALFVPLTNIFQNISYFLFGKRQFKQVTIFQGFDTLIGTILLVATVLLTKNILILLSVFLFLQFAGNLIQHFFYRPKHLEPIAEEVTKQYYSYAWHTTIRNTIFNIAFKLDNIIVFTHLGATDLAIYSIANLIPEQIKGSIKNLSSLLLIKYSRYDDLLFIKKTLLKRSLQLFFLLIAITVSYIMIAPYLFYLLFPKYVTGIIFTQIAALSFPAFISMIPLSALQSQTKESELHKINTQSSIVLLVLTISLTLNFGLMGTIIARIFYRYFIMFITYWHFYRLRS